MAAGDMKGYNLVEETETPVEGDLVRFELANGEIIEAQYNPTHDCVSVRAKQQLIIKTRASNVAQIDAERW